MVMVTCPNQVVVGGWPDMPITSRQSVLLSKVQHQEWGSHIVSASWQISQQ